MLSWLGMERVFFLQMRRILEQNLGEIDRRRIGEDRSAITVFDEHRKPAGMVQMGMRQDHVINRLRINRERFKVSLAELLRTLKNSAIHEQPLAGYLDKIFRSRYCACRAKKRELCHRPAILNDTRPPLVFERKARRRAESNPYTYAIAISRSVFPLWLTCGQCQTILSAQLNLSDASGRKRCLAAFASSD